FSAAGFSRLLTQLAPGFELGTAIPLGTGGRVGPGGLGAEGRGLRQIEEQQRVFDETRTSAEQYNIELAKLNEIFTGTGPGSVDTYNRALNNSTKSLVALCSMRRNL